LAQLCPDFELKFGERPFRLHCQLGDAHLWLGDPFAVLGCDGLPVAVDRPGF
jgi:hypothetical protein